MKISKIIFAIALVCSFAHAQKLDLAHDTKGVLPASSVSGLAQTKAAIASNWFNSYDAATGLFTATRPAYTDISGLPQFAVTKTAVTSNWIRSYDASTGLFTASQPAYSDISGTPQLAVTKTAIVSNWIRSYDSTTGLFTVSQPAYSDISGTPTLAATLANVAHKWLNSYNAATGLFTQTQPDYSDLTGLPALPANTASTLHQFFTAYNSSTGAFTKAQPDYSDLTGTPTLPATLANAAHKWFNSYSSVTGLFTQTQPDYSDLTGVPSTFAPTAHNLLSASHGDTTAAAAVRGDGVFAVGVTPTWQRLAHPSVTGGYFKWNGTDIVASSAAASGTGSPTSCTNQFVSAFTLNADAAPTSTCSTVSYGQVSGTPTLAATKAAVASNWLNSYDATTGLFTATRPAYSDITGTPTLQYQTVQDEGTPLTQRAAINFTGAGVSCADNAGASRTDCTISGGGGAGSGTVTNTAGNLTAGQLVIGNGTTDIKVGDLSGDVTTSGSAATTVAKVNGTSVPTNAAADQTVVTTASAAGAWKSIPGCVDTTGNHLNYDTATHAFSCGTSSSGGGVSSVSGTANQIASTGGSSTPVLSIANPFTFPGEGTFAAATIGSASGNIPSGTAPTTPTAGDFWRDSGGFEFFDATSTNGAANLAATNAGSVPSPCTNIVSYTADSNVAKVSENCGALQEVVQLTKTQTIQNKTLDSTDTGIWQPLGCSVTGGATGCTTASASTISVTATTARKHYIIRLIITGYSGGGGIARAQLGNTSTPDTGTNYAFGGFSIASGTSTAPTLTGVGSGSTAQSGCPVSGSATTVGRFVQMNVSNPGAVIKYFTIETSGIGASAAVTPNLAHIGCTWNNTTSGIGIIQFQACTTINGTCTTVNFNSGTSLTVWGRDDN